MEYLTGFPGIEEKVIETNLVCFSGCGTRKDIEHVLISVLTNLNSSFDVWIESDRKILEDYMNVFVDKFEKNFKYLSQMENTFVLGKFRLTFVPENSLYYQQWILSLEDGNNIPSQQTNIKIENYLSVSSDFGLLDYSDIEQPNVAIANIEGLVNHINFDETYMNSDFYQFDIEERNYILMRMFCSELNEIYDN